MKYKIKNLIKTICGLSLLYVGFYIMGNINLHFQPLQHLTLLICSIAGASVIFGKTWLKWFQKPQGKYIKIGLIALIVNYLWSFAGGILIQLIFGMQGHHANSAIGDYSLFFFVPLMLIGEELFSVTILETLRIKWKMSPFVASLITAAIFGLIHFTTYFGGNVLRTLLQILLVQGGARLIFNYVYQKTGSIWVSWAVHLVFDLIPLFILPLFLHR